MLYISVVGTQNGPHKSGPFAFTSMSNTNSFLNESARYILFNSKSVSMLKYLDQYCIAQIPCVPDAGASENAGPVGAWLVPSIIK
ncbi:hypothetical protein AYI70_g11768 [Smittium culicis]|uniref:Uncharacterized protein n=1 Tax=Smittium culicis TaxID=133412 RepID=A0A1R1X0D6_9FUNG|nr:hypothetical protein AYI70_g11768 [Smittium culicis]